MAVSVTGSGVSFSLGNVVSNPIFWGGTALLAFAYFTAKGSAQETGQGLSEGVLLLSIGGAAALVILAVNKS